VLGEKLLHTSQIWRDPPEPSSAVRCAIVWQYVALFVAVAASWAGVPFIGATVAGAAGLAASQGQLDLTAVIVVATAAGELGGLVGYDIGFRWGRQLLNRPGKHEARRRTLLADGERAYSRWGGLAVFFTPAIISGTAKMRRARFAFWNLIASFGFAVSVTASAYGLGRFATGTTPRTTSSSS
jgi:membrane protein DedA with SNARE-associated domain